MPEPIKNLLSRAVIRHMAEHFTKTFSDFDAAGFIKLAGNNLESLELKQRSTQITRTMRTFLPDDFEESAEIILASLAPVDVDNIDNSKINNQGLCGWAIMPMADYVGLYGHDYFDFSMKLLKEMTQRFSSEFGIRYFLLKDSPRTLSVLKKWARDPNYHVRRLVSEGTRPRLPWAMRLPAFIEDPTPLLPLLEVLKDDKEEYVRRSVANHLNDIAKDHPVTVEKLSKKWLIGASKEREKLVRHACRTLIKRGHQGTLKVLGFHPPQIELNTFNIMTPLVPFGDALIFELCLTSTRKRVQPLIIDYAIHHRKANGSTTAKVFKWKTLTLASLATFEATKKHAIKKITTRNYYPGTHHLEILVNGISLGIKNFELVM
ncbi:MAG: DNA alkylation repair protein [Nitrospina sp.]|jgi:3-methyladenine DNA glycosylase AlkC|nr:DNA alkylation repair protein [Nitrospina sp.]